MRWEYIFVWYNNTWISVRKRGFYMRAFPCSNHTGVVTINSQKIANSGTISVETRSRVATSTTYSLPKRGMSDKFERIPCYQWECGALCGVDYTRAFWVVSVIYHHGDCGAEDEGICTLETSHPLHRAKAQLLFDKSQAWADRPVFFFMFSGNPFKRTEWRHIWKRSDRFFSRKES